ncbi:MAG: serine/threonine protein kinase [Planctomycetes bacterium]|nr:serine/threonine protein kinase [Planctomycetota bacterium]
MAVSLSDSNVLRVRQRLGKYRIERRIAQGGFANVYQAWDSIEGVHVALKMPHQFNVTASMLDTFQREARVVAKLDHPNILPLKDASFIDGRFVIASRLGEKTLADRLKKRVSFKTALEYIEQMTSAVAYAHRNRIIHCDIKPENLILHSDGRLQLTDFGIAKVAQRTIIRTMVASGSGTIGYMAPEQAMGRPSAKSDVFSLGLMSYRILAGVLPEWPYEWPQRGYANLRRKAHPELIAWLKRSLEIRPNRRYQDANEMLRAFHSAKRKSLRKTKK